MKFPDFERKINFKATDGKDSHKYGPHRSARSVKLIRDCFVSQIRIGITM
jgi:hypothetical protein